jgi:hypothetical protein
LSARERERLKVLHEVEHGHLKQVEAARRLRLRDRHVRRPQARLRQEGDHGIVHRLRGRRSNRKIPDALKQRVLRELRQARYAGFGPTLASEHLAAQDVRVRRETLRDWMSVAGLWRTRARHRKAVHVGRPRRSAFGQLVMMDSSPYRWLEDRGQACHLIAFIDDATSPDWGDLWSTIRRKKICARCEIG